MSLGTHLGEKIMLHSCKQHLKQSGRECVKERHHVPPPPSPSLILASPRSPPLSLPAPYETVQGEKDDYVAPSVLFVSTRKPINPSKPISPRGEKISLAHIMTNSCRLFGLRHDNGEERGGREQEGDGENVGVGGGG